MKIEEVDRRILDLSLSDILIYSAISASVKNNISYHDFLIMIIEILVESKNECNKKMIKFLQNGPPPIIVKE